MEPSNQSMSRIPALGTSRVLRLLSVLILLGSLLGMPAMSHAELPGNDPACESHSESMDQSAGDDLSRVSH